ncbi:MAG: sensor domain-containing diguanylate cyclase [Sulfurimonas sp.]
MSISAILIERSVFHYSTQQVALDNALNKIEDRKDLLQTFLDRAEGTLLAVSRSDFFKNYIENGKQKNELTELFQSCVQAHENIMQLRYIDKNGYEKIRIERDKDGGKVKVIAQQNLQNKAKRYYFSESKTKKLGKVWFSAIDLNIEHGKVELPYKPTIRVMLPLEKEGQFDGILITNYFMGDLLKKFTALSLYDMILYDDRGFIIHHYDPQKSWSYFKPDKYTIMQEFPNYKDQLLRKEFLRTKGFVLKKLELGISHGLNLIVKLSEKYTFEEQQRRSKEYILLSIFVILLPLLLTYLLVRFYGKNLLNIDQLKKITKMLRNHEKALRESKDELSLIFNKASEGIALLDRNAKYVKVNPKYEELLGYSEDELKHKRCTDLTAPQYKEKTADVYKEVIKKGHYDNFQRECITKSGKVKILSSSIVFLPKKQQFLITTTDQTALHNAMEKIKAQAYIDELTQLQNRKAFNERIEELLAQYERYEITFSMLLFDIDFFKQVNDTYGHPLGDDVLIKLAKIVKSIARTNDYAYRVGGEEFVMLLTDTDKKGAVIVAEKLRKTIEESLYVTKDKKITISIGVAEIQPTDTVESIYKRADDNLYYAKENGRNQVISHLE